MTKTNTSKDALFSIQAQVDQEAISRVSRLFNAGLNDIVAELLQNARRSGASTVWFSQYTDLEMGDVIEVRDDGPGIADPATLFRLGQSRWNDDVQQKEDAAGMGFFSLAGRDVRVIAQKAGTNSSWILNADPDGFSGKAPIKGVLGPKDQRGLTIIFGTKNSENIVPAANAAAKYCPIPVMVEGVKAEQEDFLEGAQHVEIWRGLRIGIFKAKRHGGIHNPNLNFHGLTLRTSLPTLSQQYHDMLEVKIDVVSSVDLKLVLPARKEVVKDAFHSELWAKVETLLFEHVASQGPHSLAYKDYKTAKNRGINLEEACACLRPFTAAHADTDSNDWRAAESIAADALICLGSDDAVDEQNLVWAFEDKRSPVSLYEPNSAFKGYNWYDAIGVVEITGYVRELNGVRHQTPTGVLPEIIERPTRLFVVGELVTSGSITPWQVETDVILFAYADTSEVDESILCLTKEATADVNDLVDWMTRALFSPCHDLDAGSYDDQLKWFTDEAEDAAIAYLETLDAVQLNQVERILRRELYWILRPQSQITIAINGSDIEIHGLESAFQRNAA